MYRPLPTPRQPPIRFGLVLRRASPDPLEHVIAREEHKAQCKAALQSMTREEAIVLLRHERLGEPLSDVAAALHIDLDRAKELLLQAQAKLSEHIVGAP